MSEPFGGGAASSGANDRRTYQFGPNRNDAGSPSADRPANDSRPIHERIASLCEELRQRWQSGEQVPAEAYLDAFPDVAENEGAAVELILAEVWLRRQRGQAPDPDEYRRRFPNLAAALDGSWRLAGKPSADATGPFLEGLPGYELISELGRGGMGVVYKARDVKLDRTVAIKGVHLERADARARFRLEARAVAALQHPGIVQIHEVGEHRGQPYYIMQYVEGGSLADRLERTNTAPAPWSQDPRSGARLVEQLARAIHHAHTRGIVHRDLKPSNVLLTTDGSPRVADFGLVKWVEDEAEAGAREALTEPGVILGTPCYMAPEQASGGGAAVGPAADVYALGAILYHLLADQPPFAAGSSLDSLILVRTAEPVPPSRLIRSCPRDLETICLKCLEKDPVRRYGSAGELADDLQRFLDGLPVQARPLGTVGRGLKWARRHPAIASLSVAVVLSLAVCFGLVVVWWREAERANYHLHALAWEEQRGREAAQVAAAEQQRQRERAEQQLYVHLLAAAEREWLRGDAPRAHRFLQQCPEPLRRWEWHHLARRFEGSRLTLDVPGGAVAAVAFHPSRPNLLATGGGDGAVRFWEGGRETGTVVAANGPVLALAFSPDGARLAAGGPDGVVRLFDVESRREALAFRAQDVTVVSVAFSPDGARLAVGARAPMQDAVAQEARVFDARTGVLQFACSGHRGTVFAVAFAPDGKLLATGSHDRTVRLWDATTGRETGVLKGHEDLVTALAFSPDGARLASASFDRTVRLWDVSKQAAERTLLRHSQAVLGVAFSPDGRRVVSGSWDRTLRLWDASTGEPVSLRKGHRESVQALAFAPDGLSLASAARGGEVKVWGADGGREHPVLPCGRDWVPAAVFLPDGLRLASAYQGDEIAIWDVRDPMRGKTARPVLRWHAHDEDVFGLALVGDDDLVSCADDGWLKVWDARTGLLRRRWKGHDGGAYAVAAAPGGLVASGGKDGTVKLWDARSGTPLRECVTHGGEVTGVAFSPDGTRLVSASIDGSARVSEAATGRELLVFRAHGSQVHKVAFSPDGRRIASASGNRTRRNAPGDVRIWDADTGRERLKLSDGSVVFWCLAFSPDGSRLVTGNDSGAVKVWDAESGEEVLSLAGHLADDMRCLAFAPDGRFLASAGDDEQIILWDARGR